MRNQTAEITPLDSAEKRHALEWHVITCEYPPQTGGVSDYTFGVAAGLAAEGDEVHVWCPPHQNARPRAEGVVAHPELGQFSLADLRRVGDQLDRFPAPRRLLVQWVPHGYGRRSMNLGFCWWLRNRAVKHGDHVEIMLHEPFLPFRAGSFRQNGVALVHRLMTVLLLRAPQRVWMSIPGWERRLRPYALARPIPFQWLPIPSNIPVRDDPRGVQDVRRNYVSRDGFLIGHFGTFGPPITSMLEPILLELALNPGEHTIVLMGLGSQEYQRALIQKEPRLSGMIHATGCLSAADLSLHVAACDLLIQPYPDGVSSRRTSFMVGLSHAKPVVTTTGELTEACWEAAGVPMARAGDVATFVELVRRIRSDSAERARLGQAAKSLYSERFDPKYVVSTLRSAAWEDPG